MDKLFIKSLNDSTAWFRPVPIELNILSSFPGEEFFFQIERQIVWSYISIQRHTKIEAVFSKWWVFILQMITTTTSFICIKWRLACE